jgi:hypothetical protein
VLQSAIYLIWASIRYSYDATSHLRESIRGDTHFAEELVTTNLLPYRAVRNLELVAWLVDTFEYGLPILTVPQAMESPSVK